ncbi:adenosylcobinamide-phosphate guanylyltransferase [Paenibacillus thiaminolyticus]|uniref:bifunctional adenosylcobinamide kinase/adenosylcobinamide-phosphate guanylyltransferase n=1 Tax=Paenibacillus thiaminolyticus TaxID=49283 RepID=UPI001164E3E3|nr:bifunctional adenosylcobinamide kinase/adenosylcobinamide-phosphate guanylyltransferase [Paenibacillus thiaminolyticus]NGP57761.1 adenosylcobinamide-phosphate guanylyltransferase [Paenibacillus thiaminolyticus]WII36345.1 bifunctional adenosylcobinamide kinase/adenosylcobinamide-phosphate guanylyltransferase [Paenibacillus thiaminolyticus]
MIIGITGGHGSGKTSFALSYAAGFGREGLYLSTLHTSLPDGMPDSSRCRWQHLQAGEELPGLLHRINEESNLFRAERRVVVVDSVTSYLAGVHAQLWKKRPEGDNEEYDAIYIEEIAAARKRLQEALFAFQGKLFLITNDPPAYTPFTDPKEQSYIIEHAALNRELARRSHQWFRLESGMPEEVSARRFRG